MTDQPEKKSETEDVGEDFEGHKLHNPEKKFDITDVKNATDDDDADFEGHRFASPEKKADISNRKA